jgi:hypothetical protein
MALHASTALIAMVTAQAAGSCEITVRDFSGTATDGTSLYVMACGDQ